MFNSIVRSKTDLHVSGGDFGAFVAFKDGSIVMLGNHQQYTIPAGKYKVTVARDGLVGYHQK